MNFSNKEEWVVCICAPEMLDCCLDKPLFFVPNYLRTRVVKVFIGWHHDSIFESDIFFNFAISSFSCSKWGSVEFRVDRNVALDYHVASRNIQVFIVFVFLPSTRFAKCRPGPCLTWNCISLSSRELSMQKKNSWSTFIAFLWLLTQPDNITTSAGQQKSINYFAFKA